METPETQFENSYDAASAALANMMGENPDETLNSEVQDAPMDEAADTEVETLSEEKTADPNLEAAQTLLSAIQAGGQTAQQVLLGLAKSAGLAVEFKENQVAVVKSLKDILVEKIGEDNSFLAEQLSAGLEEYLNVREQKYTAQIEELKSRDSQNAISSEINATTANLAKFDDFKTLETKMIELSAELKPAAGISPEKYLKILYTAAGGKSKLSTAPSTQKIAPQRVVSPALDRAPQAQPVPVDREIHSFKHAAEIALEQLLNSSNKN